MRACLPSAAPRASASPVRAAQQPFRAFERLAVPGGEAFTRLTRVQPYAGHAFPLVQPRLAPARGEEERESLPLAAGQVVADLGAEIRPQSDVCVSVSNASIWPFGTLYVPDRLCSRHRYALPASVSRYTSAPQDFGYSGSTRVL